MIYPSIDKILNIVDSKYRLVHIVAERSKELTREQNYQKKISEYESSKNMGRALEEVAEGDIILKKEN